MSHWADASPDDDDAEESLVRPYTITHGRTASARDDLTLITVIVTVAPGERTGDRGLQPEHRMILRQCRTAVALAEVAAGLNLPVAVTKILIGDLIALDRVTARPPLAVGVGQTPDMTLLQAVKDALLRL
ncbi:DUF742 domain-containing protein [Streptomyces sp. WI04-05B]|uniref:DUF742 domain-containing protein n=1 Tax=Streptomyces TaxID=1883 RepID=UPI0029A8AF17|nr:MULTISPECIES: DUF742 domain-containing protein [unclassified Streptomyces]MDX2543877.1 DUF742 domain-containing protein [Streptomyces sp. WI04-05B]MDX2582033.1 DUF742 domain-containing protein [Streptomyces sp. WI04-05A]MDX3752445.1 DUF742 domain-containing protein [Streptomyces sp. AK08-02]